MNFSADLDFFIVESKGRRRPGVDPLDGGERLLGGLCQDQTGDGLSRGGKVTFTMQKTSHSVWRDTWIAGYIDQVTKTLNHGDEDDLELRTENILGSLKIPVGQNLSDRS